MNSSIANTFKLAATVALAAFAFTGCMTKSNASADASTDGGNVVAAQETNNMAVLLTESPSLKIAVAAGDTDTVTKEKVVVLLHYDPLCQCFVRSTEFLNKKGFERQRVDSIWLDSSGHMLNVFVPGHANSITHVRHVTRINGYSNKNVDITIKTTLVKTLVNGIIVFQWTGTMTGTFNGTEFRTSSFSFTRTYTPGVGFGYENGSLDLHRGDYDIIIFFDASSKSANCTVSLKGVFVRTTSIDKDDNEI